MTIILKLNQLMTQLGVDLPQNTEQFTQTDLAPEISLSRVKKTEPKESRKIPRVEET